MISKHRGLGTCAFCHRGGFERLEAVASLDAYQITNYQFLSKTHQFLLPDSEEFEKKFLNQDFYSQLLEQAWSKGSFDFSKLVPLGAPRSLIQMVSKWNGVFIEVGLLPTVITNSFENPIIKNLETFFLSFFCTNFMIMTFIPLFRNISKIHNDKGI